MFEKPPTKLKYPKKDKDNGRFIILQTMNKFNYLKKTPYDLLELRCDELSKKKLGRKNIKILQILVGK